MPWVYRGCSTIDPLIRISSVDCLLQVDAIFAILQGNKNVRVFSSQDGSNIGVCDFIGQQNRTVDVGQIMI